MKQGLYVLAGAIVLLAMVLLAAILTEDEEPVIIDDGPSMAEEYYGCDPGEIAEISTDGVECLAPEDVTRD